MAFALLRNIPISWDIYAYPRCMRVSWSFMKRLIPILKCSFGILTLSLFAGEFNGRFKWSYPSEQFFPSLDVSCFKRNWLLIMMNEYFNWKKTNNIIIIYTHNHTKFIISETQNSKSTKNSWVSWKWLSFR